MCHRSARSRGFTLVELLVVIGIIALLAAVLMPALQVGLDSSYRARCSSHQGQLHKGLAIYLNNFEQFFPLAWLRTGDDARLGQLTYWRLLVNEQCDPGFARFVNPAASETAQGKFDRNQRFWRDGARGWTRDYFAPSLIFRGHLNSATQEIDPSQTADYDRHAQASELTQHVPPTQRPLLTGVDASYDEVPDGDEAPASKGPLHKADLESGWTVTSLAAPPVASVFIGVGRSLRTAGDYGDDSTRFDFRHGGAANFLFLDGHVDAVKATDKARLRLIHERWNRLAPADE